MVLCGRVGCACLHLYLGECSLEFLAAYGVDGEVERAVDDGAEPAKQVKDAGEGPFLVAQLQPLHKPVSRNSTNHKV